MLIDEKLPIKVLAIDNDETTLLLLKDILQQYVDSVILSTSYKEAISIFEKQNNINIVIVNINMPHIDSTEFLKAFHDIKSNVCIVAIIADNDIIATIKYLKLGFYSVLKKPIDPVWLYGLLANAYELECAIKDKKNAHHIFLEYSKAIDNGFMVSKTNINGIITFANDAFCKISGYSHDELIGKPHNIVRHPKMNSDIFANMWKTILNKKIWRGKIINKAKNGSAYYVDTVLSPIIDSNGDIIEFLAIRQDITKLIQTHQKVLKEQNEKALIAKIHYEELSKSKITLLNLFSHELKTPLNAVVNFSNIVYRRLNSMENLADKSNTLELIGYISQNASQMEIMINDIVSVMKLQARAFTLHLQKMTLTDFIFDKIKSVTHTKNIDIKTNFCNNPSVITLDAVFASKIFDNLYSNALKYAKSYILISYEQANDQFILSVQDDGVGFANPNMQIELFEQNDDDILTRESQGVGIGLYHAKLCAQALDWALELSNKDSIGGACVKIIGKIK